MKFFNRVCLIIVIASLVEGSDN